jgi:hypothetical protein
MAGFEVSTEASWCNQVQGTTATTVVHGSDGNVVSASYRFYKT